MTAINKKDTQRLASVFSGIMDHLVTDVHMNVDRLFRVFWTDEQAMEAKSVEKFISRGNLSGISEVIRCSALMPEFTGAQSTEVHMDIRLAYNKRCLAPTFANPLPGNVPDDIRQEYEAAVASVAEKAVVRGYWRGLQDLYAQCTSHEAMRYLFPGTVYMLRRAGLHDIASKVESIRKVPSLPTLTPYDRQCIKYMNEWFGVQMLLGTFEGNDDRPNAQYNNSVVLRLWGDTEVPHPDYPGINIRLIS